MLDGHDLKLIVNGKAFGGWLDVRVERGIEQAAGSFHIGATQRWPGLATHFDIPKFSPCEVRIDDDLVLTGFVDRVAGRRSGSAASLEISGRSRTADMIDCSPDFTDTELAGLSLAEVARRVAAPFKVSVVATGDAATGQSFAVASKHHGETAWRLIERLARQRQLLVMDDEKGNLVLAHLGETRAKDRLVHPADGTLVAGFADDTAGRFSEYRVKAQAGERWSDVNSDVAGVPAALAHVEGSFRDPDVPRYRPKTILSEGAAKKEGAMARAEWECRRNMGRSRRVSVTRVGWRQRDGSLWKPNQLVQVELPQLNVQAELALATVRYIKSEATGTICEMELSPPEAFTPEPPEQPGGTGGQGARWGDVLANSGSG